MISNFLFKDPLFAFSEVLSYFAIIISRVDPLTTRQIMDQKLMFLAMMLLILPSISALGKNVLFVFCFVLCSVFSRHIVFLKVRILGKVKKESKRHCNFYKDSVCESTERRQATYT